MAKHGKTVIVHEFGTPRVALPVANADTFFEGDLLAWDTSNKEAEVVDAAADDAIFIGIAGEAKVANDGKLYLAVVSQCIIEIDATSATYEHGLGVLYSAGSGTVEYSVADDGGANTIGNVWGYFVSATRIKVLIDVLHVAKRFEMNA